MKQKRNSFFKFPMLTALATAVVILALSLTAGVGNHTVMATLDTGNPVQDELNIKTGTLVSNVFAFGESLSGLTVEEAVAKINRATSTVLTKRLHAISADADKEWTATFQDLGIHLEETNATETLRSCILSGTVLERYKMAKDREKDPIVISPGLVFDPDSIRAAITDALSSWNQEPVETIVTVRQGGLNIVPGQNGHTYDFTEGLDSFINTLKSGSLS
ncbi:MAG: peptidoglycan binding domain-containing protein, partial [Lachnospiraceae bacterium]|nr:peptidoglycan binding domain-containing protein [Lachnospiraceae bacterium]